jgi:hypothetical protein
MRPALLTITSLLLLCSCDSIKNVRGKYQTQNIALDLKPDSTFEFDMSYHMIGAHATGRYEVREPYIRLYYDNDDVDTLRKGLRINCLYYSNRKLFTCDSTGNIESSKFFLSKVKSTN